MTRLGVVANATEFGGAERYLQSLAMGLTTSSGWTVSLIGEVPAWDGPSVPTGVGPKWSRREILGSASRATREAKATYSVISKEHKIDPFSCFLMQYKREQVTLTHKLSRLAPVIWVEHGPFPRQGIGRLLMVPYGYASRAVSHVICVSERVHNDLSGLVDPRKLVTIPNAVDIEVHSVPTDGVRRRSRERLGALEGEVVVAFVGRLHPEKRPMLAVEAIRLMAENSKLIIAGAGSELNALQTAALGLPVSVLGHVNDLAAVYDAADCLVVTSSPAAREGAPLVFLEAAAHGVPAVAVRGSGLELDVRTAGGVVVEPNASALSEGIGQVVSGGIESRRAQARAFAEQRNKHQWITRVDSTLRAYADFI